MKVLYLKDIWNDKEWNINYGEMNKEIHCQLWWDISVSLAPIGEKRQCLLPRLFCPSYYFEGDCWQFLGRHREKNDKESLFCEISTHKSTRRHLTGPPNKLLTMGERHKNGRRKKPTAALNAKQWYTPCRLALGQLQLCHSGFLFPNELYFYRCTCLSERRSGLLFSLLSQDGPHFISGRILLSKASLDVRSWRPSVETFVNGCTLQPLSPPYHTVPSSLCLHWMGF